MCTYSQLKKKLCVIPPPSSPGVNGASYVPKWYASSGIDISKCIESGCIQFTKLVDYNVCAVTSAFPCNYCISF